MKAKVIGILRLIVLSLPVCLLVYCIICGIANFTHEQPNTNYNIITSLPKTELKSRNPSITSVIIESIDDKDFISNEVSEVSSEIEESSECIESSQDVFENSIEVDDKENVKHPMGVESEPLEESDVSIDYKPHPNFVYYDSYFDTRYNRTYNIALSEEHQAFAYSKCQEYGVPFEIMMGLWGAEASWNVYIGETVSAAGDHYYGIGQINIYYNEKYLKQYGVDLCTPLGGLEGSIIVIRDKLERHGGDINKALMAYNAGDYGASKQWDKGVHSTTYTRLIISIANNLKEGN